MLSDSHPAEGTNRSPCDDGGTGSFTGKSADRGAPRAAGRVLRPHQAGQDFECPPLLAGLARTGAPCVRSLKSTVASNASLLVSLALPTSQLISISQAVAVLFTRRPAAARSMTGHGVTDQPMMTRPKDPAIEASAYAYSRHPPMWRRARAIIVGLATIAGAIAAILALHPF